jgi:hypothetical protein
MKNFIIALCFCVGALHAHNVMANGENNGPKCNNRSCNTTTNYNDESITNKAYGGSAYSKAYGGNAKAYGGSAYQGQDQGQYQGQGQLGIVKNVGPQVVITDESVTTFEEKYQAPSMVAPGIDTSQVNVECPLFVQDGWSAGASGPGAGLSAGATDAEAIPTCFALLAAKNSTGEAKQLAGAAFYCLAFEAAGVDNSECDGWRDAVRGGPAPAVRDFSVREGR